MVFALFVRFQIPKDDDDGHNYDDDDDGELRQLVLGPAFIESISLFRHINEM